MEENRFQYLLHNLKEIYVGEDLTKEQIKRIGDFIDDVFYIKSYTIRNNLIIFYLEETHKYNDKIESDRIIINFKRIKRYSIMKMDYIYLYRIESISL